MPGRAFAAKPNRCQVWRGTVQIALDSRVAVWLMQARHHSLPLSAVRNGIPPLASSSSADLLTSSLGMAQPEARVLSRANASARFPFLDLMRAIASQLIVLHHLAFYGPLSERAYEAAPLLFDWLIDYARMAVQVFLVIGGFLSARSISKISYIDAPKVRSAIFARYRRIGVPYLATLAVAILVNEAARRFMTHDAISARPTLGQLVAHTAFLHDILGYEALTAGIWYLAIDFQLYIVMLLLFWCCSKWQRRWPSRLNFTPWQLSLLVIAPIAVLSLLWFNRQASLDCWAIYFIGAYFLGLLLNEMLSNPALLRWAGAYWCLAVAVALYDSRPRLLVAAMVALIVALAERFSLLRRWPDIGIVNYLGRISYSLFLIHFPVLLLINAMGARVLTSSTPVAIFGLLLAYVASLAAGFAFYHSVEKRIR